jgi:hypothetical protein
MAVSGGETWSDGPDAGVRRLIYLRRVSCDSADGRAAEATGRHLAMRLAQEGQSVRVEVRLRRDRSLPDSSSFHRAVMTIPPVGPDARDQDGDAFDEATQLLAGSTNESVSPIRVDRMAAVGSGGNVCLWRQAVIASCEVIKR